jgi:hypothetical protein
MKNDNKLIVEFMGVKPQLEVHYEMYGVIENIEDEVDEKHFFLVEELKFHSDWNWLMQVINKIINLKEVFTQERQEVYKSINPNIDLTYKSVVEFIKWYNFKKL